MKIMNAKKKQNEEKEMEAADSQAELETENRRISQLKQTLTCY